MDEKGTTMTDSGPLVKIKQAITKIKNELIQMELRIGVVSYLNLGLLFFVVYNAVSWLIPIISTATARGTNCESERQNCNATRHED